VGIVEELKPGPVALDTAIFIYFIEEEPRYLRLIEPVFEAIDRGVIEGVTSSLTLLEVLVQPYRAGNLALAERYEAFLTGSRGLRFIGIDQAVLRGAAQLRARTNLKPPDAIQLATALVTGCSAFLTNDRAVPVIPGLKVLQLRDYLPAAHRR